MEIKCEICGTINSGDTNFCKGCFQKLDSVKKTNNVTIDKPTVVVSIEDEEKKIIPWDENEITKVESPIDSVELLKANESLKDQPIQVNSDNYSRVVVDNISENIEEQADEPISEEIEANNEVSTELNVESNIQEQIEEPILEEIEANNEVEPELNDNENNLDDWNVPLETVVEQNDSEPIQEGIPELMEEQPVDWDLPLEEEPVVEVKEPNYIFKFLLVYLIFVICGFGILIFTLPLLLKTVAPDINEIISFASYRLMALFTLIIPTIIVFKKKYPKKENINKITFKILFFIALPSILIQLFVLGFIKDTKVLMFIIGCMLSIIILTIFFSFIRNYIKKKNNDKSEDKVFFRYGIVSIILIVILLLLGMFARTKNWDMPKIDFLYDIFAIKENNDEIIYDFVYQVEKNILKNQVEDEEYVIPLIIKDVKFAKHGEYIPDSINLNINSEGAVKDGTIVYRGITYTYDGQNIKAK